MIVDMKKDMKKARVAGENASATQTAKDSIKVQQLEQELEKIFIERNELEAQVVAEQNQYAKLKKKMNETEKKLAKVV